MAPDCDRNTNPKHPGNRAEAEPGAGSRLPAARLGAWGLPRELAPLPLWRMALWFVPTFGLYGWVWLGLRREAFNRFDSPCKLWKGLFWAAFWVGLAGGLFAAPPRPGLVLPFAVLGVACSLGSSLGYFFLLFCAKAALEDHMQAQGGTVRINRWWLLLFGCFYLQHVLNLAHKRSGGAVTARPALQTGPIAASTPP